jgi:predicted dehydrogenase
MLKVAIVGAGSIGRVRATVIQQSPDCALNVVADVEESRATELAGAFRAQATTDLAVATHSPEIDVVVVCTPTKYHATTAIEALRHGKHVLCEKPLARTAAEAREMVDAASQSGSVLKTGFNYRYMAHVRKAKEILERGSLGPLYFVRSTFGHGGRPGYEKSWCTDQDLSGGGVLLEQGIHIIDLLRYLICEPVSVVAQMPRFFWNFPAVEDNCFALLKTSFQICEIHVSWTQWINKFSFEIFGRDGYLLLTGRDGHYGPQRLIWGKRQDNHGRPQEECFNFPLPDDSWRLEWNDFCEAIKTGRKPQGTAHDGLRALQIIAGAYESASQNKWVNVGEYF